MKIGPILPVSSLSWSFLALVSGRFFKGVLCSKSAFWNGLTARGRKPSIIFSLSALRLLFLALALVLFSGWSTVVNSADPFVQTQDFSPTPPMYWAKLESISQNADDAYKKLIEQASSLYYLSVPLNVTLGSTALVADMFGADGWEGYYINYDQSGMNIYFFHCFPSDNELPDGGGWPAGDPRYTVTKIDKTTEQILGALAGIACAVLLWGAIIVLQ